MIVSIYPITEELRKHGVSDEDLKLVRSAFALAQEIHKDQERESREPYIIHPLSVAEILMKDLGVYVPNAVAAALLHDTIEDATVPFTKDNIAAATNERVASLVEGVTKLKAMEFPDKAEKVAANQRKLFNAIKDDILVYYIKLADRIHNMRTLKYKQSKVKQKENALETLEVFAPLSDIGGSYKGKNELEEYALMYIDQPAYEEIIKRREELKRKDQLELEEMAATIQDKLNEKGIKGRIVFREQSPYTIYKRLEKGYKIENQYDLHYLKVIVDSIPDCYSTLGIIHSCFKPVNGRFKDYIYSPRTNTYQSIHTRVSYNDREWKFKIRTEEMDKIDAFGYSAYWSIKDFNNVAPIKYGRTPEETNEILRNNQVLQKILEIDQNSANNAEFIERLRKEVLSAQVYVYNTKGDVIEMPAGSTVLDYICEVYPDKVDTITSIVVNGIEVMPDTLLNDDDTIRFIEEGKITHENWENYATSDSAKKKMKELQRGERKI